MLQLLASPPLRLLVSQPLRRYDNTAYAEVLAIADPTDATTGITSAVKEERGRFAYEETNQCPISHDQMPTSVWTISHH